MNQFKQFNLLLEVWARDVASSSNKRKHINFDKIIEMPDAIDFACVRLGDGPIHELFSILYHLVPEYNHPPVDKFYSGRIPVFKECWKYWALKNKVVSVKYDPNSYWVEDKYGNKGFWH